MATTVMMVFRDTDTGSQPTNLTSHIEPQRQRHSRSVLEKPSFNRDTQDRYVKVMNFEMEVMNILEMSQPVS